MRKAQDAPVFLAAAAEIKARRALLRISQEELAHRAGMHRSYIARMEVASTQPSLAGLFRLAAALEADVVDVVSGISSRLVKERRRVRRKKVSG
jgi:predicted transcriptional regulator